MLSFLFFIRSRLGLFRYFFPSNTIARAARAINFDDDTYSKSYIYFPTWAELCSWLPKTDLSLNRNFGHLWLIKLIMVSFGSALLPPKKSRRKNEYIRIYWTNTLSKPIQWNEFQTIRIIPLITFNRVFPSPFINGEHKINLKLLFYKSSWNCKITILQSGEEQRNKKKHQEDSDKKQ